MRPFLLPIVLTLASAFPALADEAFELDAMTFNIRNGMAKDGENRWDVRKELVFGVIRDHAPDVVGLQEAFKFQNEAILEAVPEYELVGRSRERDPDEGEWCPILYRTDRFAVAESGTFWLSDTPEELGSKSWGNQIPRICTWAVLEEEETGRLVAIYNTHFDHRSQPSREASAKLCLERMKAIDPDIPIVFMGDLNAGEDNPVNTALTEGGWADSFRIAQPDAEEVGTFSRWDGYTEGPKIDYIYVFQENAPVIVDAEILHDHSDDGKYPSDHYPVSATLRWD